VNYASMQINFAMVFSQGAFAHVPHSYIATVKLPAAKEMDVYRKLTQQFPLLSAIPVKESLQRIAETVGAISQAMHWILLLVAIAGTLVVAGTIRALFEERLESVVSFRLLGARYGQLTMALVGEWVVIAVLTMLLASIAGFAGGYFLLIRFYANDIFLPIQQVSLLLITSMILYGSLAYFLQRRLLHASVVPYLRAQ
jgi:putative ABC transport system permease protein